MSGNWVTLFLLKLVLLFVLKLLLFLPLEHEVYARCFTLKYNKKMKKMFLHCHIVCAIIMRTLNFAF